MDVVTQAAVAVLDEWLEGGPEFLDLIETIDEEGFEADPGDVDERIQEILSTFRDRLRSMGA